MAILNVLAKAVALSDVQIKIVSISFVIANPVLADMNFKSLHPIANLLTGCQLAEWF